MLLWGNILEQVTRPPKDGFLSIKDQRDLTDLETLKQIKALEKHNRKETLLKYYSSI